MVYLYVTGSGSISSVGTERANLSAVVMWFLFWVFPLPIGAWDGLRYFIVALPMSVICHPQILRFPEVLASGALTKRGNNLLYQPDQVISNNRPS